MDQAGMSEQDGVEEISSAKNILVERHCLLQLGGWTKLSQK